MRIKKSNQIKLINSISVGGHFFVLLLLDYIHFPLTIAFTDAMTISSSSPLPGILLILVDNHERDVRKRIRPPVIAFSSYFLELDVRPHYFF